MTDAYAGHANARPQLARLAAIAAGFALLYVASTTCMELAAVPLASIGPESASFFLAGILVGLVFALTPARLIGPRALPLVALGFCMVGMVTWAASTTGVSPVSLLLIGIGDALLLLTWGRELAVLSPALSLMLIAAAYGIGKIGGVALAAWGPEDLALAIASAAAGTSALLALGLRPRSTPTDDPIETPDLEEIRREALSFLWKPLVASALCSFITGASGAAGYGVSPQLLITDVLGIALTCCALVVYATVPRLSFSSHRFYRTFIPLAAIVILCIPLLTSGDTSSLGQTIVGVLNSCGFSLLDIAVISALAVASRAFSLPSEPLFGLGRALGAGAMLLGMALQSITSITTMRALCAALTAIYLGSVVISLVRSSEREHEMGTALAPNALTISGLCERLATEANLSPREAQILPYLARGRGSTFIGDELCISAKTVKTHTKHIYDKLDIHSREELLDLFSEAEQP